MFNTIAQKVFGKPRFTKVHLDEMGTFIWPLIDGKYGDGYCGAGKRRISVIRQNRFIQEL